MARTAKILLQYDIPAEESLKLKGCTRRYHLMIRTTYEFFVLPGCVDKDLVGGVSECVGEYF